MAPGNWLVSIGALSAVALGGCASQPGKAFSPPAWTPGPYLKAEVAYSKARDAGMRDDNPNSAECVMQTGSSPPCAGSLDSLGSGWALGLGVGYRFAGPFRGDITYQQRTGFDLKGADAAGTSFDPDVKSDSVMVNGYYDLPVVMNSIRPYIGGGIGRSRNQMDPLRWNDPACCSGTLTGGKTTSTAWQFTLGADVLLEKSWILELYYRYADMGEFKKDRGADQANTFGTGVTGSMTGKLRADEIGVAIRYSLR